MSTPVRLPLQYRLNTNVLTYGLFPLLERLRDLISLASTCKAMRSLVFSANNIWSPDALGICMRTGCCGCGREPVSLALVRLIVMRTAVTHIVGHLRYGDLIPFLLVCLENKKGRPLRRLQLLLEPPPPVDEPGSTFFTDCADLDIDDASSAFSTSSSSSATAITNFSTLNIEDLVLSLPEHEHEDDDGSCFSEMFRIVGQNLRIVKLRLASPSNLFASLPTSRLEHLEVDSPLRDFNQLLALELPSLVHLRLNNAKIRISDTLCCPRLQTFEFYGRFADDGNLLWRNEDDVKAAITALPPSLIFLELRLDSQFINIVLCAIADRFPLLESLILEMPDEVELIESTKVSKNTLLALIRGCPTLYVIELRNSYVTFSTDAFLYLAQFRRLRKLRFIYDEDTIELLPDLLDNSSALEEIHLYQDRAEMFDETGDDSRWETMVASVEMLCEKFSAVALHLEDESLGDDI